MMFTEFTFLLQEGYDLAILLGGESQRKLKPVKKKTPQTTTKKPSLLSVSWAKRKEFRSPSGVKVIKEIANVHFQMEI